MQGDTLDLLEKLRAALGPDTSADQKWGLVMSIEASLASDPRHSKREQSLLQQLRSGVSKVIALERDGHDGGYSFASVPLLALESSIKDRTTGLDGWPLGRRK